MIIIKLQCDLTYSTDQHFWPTLKEICGESRIPIVLTCNDYYSVRKELYREPTLDNFRTFHTDRPSAQELAQYLRVWIAQ